MVHKGRAKVRSIFISDTHLGCIHSKGNELLNFLRSYDCDNLYLVGDFIDGWKLGRGFWWCDTYSFILRRIFGMMKDGTSVRYVVGNHDEFLREYLHDIDIIRFGHLEFGNEFIHETPDGRKLLVIHGDYFDQFTAPIKWLYRLGDEAYSFILWLNTIVNYVRRKLGFQYKSYSKKIKQNVKKAVNYINNFEHLVAVYTRRHGCAGVVCGHIHHAVIKPIEEVMYYNCGDWVESCTALIEHYDGNIELIDLMGHSDFNNGQAKHHEENPEVAPLVDLHAEK